MGEGTWTLTDDDSNLLHIELTAIDDPKADGEDVVEKFDPEVGSQAGLTFVEELDAPDGCRLLQYKNEEDATDMFLGLCSNDEFGLFVYGTEEDAVEDVSENFMDDADNIVPEGYVDGELDDDSNDDSNDDADD